MAHMLNKSRAWVMAHSDTVLFSDQLKNWQSLVSQLRLGVPLPYVLGRWEFFGMEFIVSPDVLIPRPETELLVENALDWINKPNMAIRSCVDVGTGSGCIAIALAIHAPELSLTAIDINPAALRIARANAGKHGLLDRIRFVESDLLDSSELTGKQFDLLVANLPYIPSRTLRQLEVSDHEPSLALEGGPDGLVLIRRLLETSLSHISPGGALLLEIEVSQGKSALALARSAYPQAECLVLPDFSCQDRLLSIHL